MISLSVVADFYTLPIIARRLGLTTSGLKKWYARDGVFMFKRCQPGPGCGRKGGPGRGHAVWYTNDALIQAWELSQVQVQRRRWIARRAARDEIKGVSGKKVSLPRPRGQVGATHHGRQ